MNGGTHLADELVDVHVQRAQTRGAVHGSGHVSSSVWLRVRPECGDQRGAHGRGAEERHVHRLACNGAVRRAQDAAQLRRI